VKPVTDIMAVRGAVALARVASQAPRRPGVFPTLVDAENGLPFWCLMLFTFVLFIAPQNFFASLEPLHLAQIAAGLAVIAYFLNLIVTRRPVTVVTPEVRLVAWFVLVVVASIPFSLSPGGSVEYLFGTFLKSVVIFFLIANLVETVERLKLLIASIVSYGFIISATALYHFATGQTMSRDPGRIWGYSNQLAANPVDLALILNVILALTVGLYWVARRPFVKMLLLAAMALAVAGVIASFSRGGFLALSLILAVLLVRSIRTRGPMVLLAASALVVAGIFLAPAGYADRLYSLFDWSRDRVGSMQTRSLGLEVAFTSILESPLVGAGLGMEGLLYNARGLLGKWETHSVFLLIGADLGLPGLLVYVLLFVQILRGLRQTQRRLGQVPEATEVVALAAGLELAVYGFLVGAAFLPVAYGFTAYYLAGLAAAIRVIGAQLTAPPLPTR
jgi:O-antigen ligase